MRRSTIFSIKVRLGLSLVFMVAGYIIRGFDLGPFGVWIMLVAGITAVGAIGSAIQKSKQSMDDICKACRYPLDAVMVRCPECGLRRDGEPDPPKIAALPKHTSDVASAAGDPERA